MALVLGLSAGLACGAALGSTVKLPPWLFALALVPLVIACTRRSPSWLWSAAFLVATALTSPPSFPPRFYASYPSSRRSPGGWWGCLSRTEPPCPSCWNRPV